MSDFPFLDSAASTEEEELPTFKMYDYDFEKNDFVRDGNGQMILLEGNDALKIWLIKMLKTSRFTWLAYSDRYGCEVYDWIGKVTKKPVAESELRRLLTESIMVNPFVKSIDEMNFNHERRGNELTIDITLTTVYGKLEV